MSRFKCEKSYICSMGLRHMNQQNRYLSKVTLSTRPLGKTNTHHFLTHTPVLDKVLLGAFRLLSHSNWKLVFFPA